MTNAECSGFWNGCGFQWMMGVFGPNIAGAIVVAIAVLYIIDYLQRDKPKVGDLDILANEHNNQKSHTSTDIRHTKGKQK